MPIPRPWLLVFTTLWLGLLLPDLCHADPTPPKTTSTTKTTKSRRKPKKAPKEELPPPPPPEPLAPPSPGLAHIIAGNKLFQDEHYDQAIVELQAAYALDPMPRLLFNIASAQRRAGLLREALASYQLYLQKDPSGELKDKAIAYIGSLKEGIAEQERRTRPFYKKAWFWGVVGGVVVATGLGLGLGLGLRPQTPQTDKGIYVLNF